MRLFAAFAIVFVLAATTFFYSRTLPHWKDKAGFDAEYAALKDLDPTDHDAAMQAYGALFDAHVTIRNDLKRYSLCFMVLAGSGMLLSLRGLRGLRAPPRRFLVVVTGVLAVALSAIGMALDAGEQYGRGELPIFANDHSVFPGMMAIELYGLILVGANSLALREADGTSARIADIRLRGWDHIIAAELGVSVVLAGLLVLAGGYFLLMATPAWFYFYLSILAFRTRAA